MKLFKRKFPFPESPNTMCFTCCHILNDNEPIAYISHDEDGCWQFLCGRNHTEDEARIVSLSEMLEIDKSVAKFADLKRGEYAEDCNGSWFVQKRIIISE